MRISSPLQAAPGPAPRPAPDLAACVERLLAFFLQWAGLLGRPADPQTAAVSEAIQALAALLARCEAGEFLPASHANAVHAPADLRHNCARLPRSARRILLTPGIFAGLFFTRRAIVAAGAYPVAPPQPAISVFAVLPPRHSHVHFVAISY